jgi:hypothetical protein
MARVGRRTQGILLPGDYIATLHLLSFYSTSQHCPYTVCLFALLLLRLGPTMHPWLRPRPGLCVLLLAAIHFICAVHLRLFPGPSRILNLCWRPIESASPCWSDVMMCLFVKVLGYYSTTC